METQTDIFEEGEGAHGPAPLDLVLVVMWSVEEPWRVGEVTWFVEQEAAMIGRGEGKPGDVAPRAAWLRQRPGHTRRAPALGGRRISRQQLHVVREGASLRVRNVGKGRLVFCGASVDACVLKPGDLVVIGGALVLMCDQRRRGWDASAEGFPGAERPDFGAPDAQGMVGECPVSWDLRRQVAFLGRREKHVLVLGDSGTGKELAARGLHAHSARHPRQMLARNAATIPEGLFDAELFGNIRDYPNPGMKERPGLVGESSGSTLFLDEVGEIPEALQAHLLRLLDQDGAYHRLGEARARRSDVRLVVATNRAEAELKHDFLARFVLRLTLPTLNARRADIPLLIVHLMREAARSEPSLMTFFREHQGQHHPRLTPALVEALVRHQYTHHVRELEVFLWSALTACAGETWLDLGAEVEGRLRIAASVADDDEEGGEPDRAQILAAMRRHDGVREKVWRVLGLKNRYVLRRLLKKHDIKAQELEER